MTAAMAAEVAGAAAAVERGGGGQQESGGGPVHNERDAASLAGVDPDSFDFVLCLGNFSARDEDIFLKLHSAEQRGDAPEEADDGEDGYDDDGYEGDESWDGRRHMVGPVSGRLDGARLDDFARESALDAPMGSAEDGRAQQRADAAAAAELDAFASAEVELELAQGAVLPRRWDGAVAQLGLPSVALAESESELAQPAGGDGALQNAEGTRVGAAVGRQAGSERGAADVAGRSAPSLRQSRANPPVVAARRGGRSKRRILSSEYERRLQREQAAVSALGQTNEVEVRWIPMI
eukprot:1053771-Pleurochrysis_carterae.AAC.1